MELSFLSGMAGVAGAFLGFLVSYIYYSKRLEESVTDVL